MSNYLLTIVILTCSCFTFITSPPLLGGFIPIDLSIPSNMEMVNKAAKFAINQLITTNALSLTRVTNAFIQVVAGINIRLTAKLNAANCTDCSNNCHFLVFLGLDKNTTTYSLIQWDCLRPIL